jgi:C4-dicarboxylate transporter, DctM subunit
MDPMVLSAICILSLFVFMMLGIPIVYSLAFASVFGGLLAYGTDILGKLGWTPFQLLFNLSWTPLPLFVLIGSLIAETDMGRDLFKAAIKWLARVPGGLIVAAIFGEGVMAAALGTSAACIMVVGKVAVPEFDRHGYNRSLGLGALLAGGLLGPLIPPSATMIIFAILTNNSLGKLFIAGIIPGILLIFMLAATAIIICIVKPAYAPKVAPSSWGEKFTSITRVWPIVFCILAILGSIYFGLATPTESAGIGCVVVLIIAIVLFKLRWKGLKNAIVDAALINGMIIFILVWASFFTYMVGSSNVAKYMLDFINAAHFSPWMVIIVINVIYILLGFVLDPLTITFLTIPIFYPIIYNLGFDPIWFGIVFVVNTQLGLITPPMAVDLFAVRTVFGIPTGDLIRGVMPFLIVEFFFLALLIAFPQISLWLPGIMIGK